MIWLQIPRWKPTRSLQYAISAPIVIVFRRGWRLVLGSRMEQPLLLSWLFKYWIKVLRAMEGQLCWIIWLHCGNVVVEVQYPVEICGARARCRTSPSQPQPRTRGAGTQPSPQAIPYIRERLLKPRSTPIP